MESTSPASYVELDLSPHGPTDVSPINRTAADTDDAVLQLHYPPHSDGGSSAMNRGALLRPNGWGDCGGRDGCSGGTCGRLRCRELITIRGGAGVNHYRMNIITEWIGGGDSG